MFLPAFSPIERCDLPPVEATEHQSHLTGHPSRLPKGLGVSI